MRLAIKHDTEFIKEIIVDLALVNISLYSHDLAIFSPGYGLGEYSWSGP